MHTIELLPRDWARALDEFSTVHEGWLVSLEVLDRDLGAQPEIRDLPLVGITAETGGRQSTITITAGRTSEGQITHAIPSPTHVRIEQTDDDADVAVEIHSSEGASAILRFRASAAPGTVNGVVRP